MEKLKHILLDKMSGQDFDTLGVASVDFSIGKFESFVLTADETLLTAPCIFFDLASITKPLTLHLMYLLHQGDFKEEWMHLLHHQAGLPPYAWLDKKIWRSQVKDYKLSASATLYSDLSAIRLGLEIEDKYQKSLNVLVRPHHHHDVLHWSVLPPYVPCPATGFRNGKVIRGEVHDPRAFITRDYMSHAGLFSTINGLAETLMNWQKKFNFIEKTEEYIKSHPDQRFALGWDRAQDAKLSLAGAHFSPTTFGHSGFVGNMVWVNPVKRKAVIVLSNGTQRYWYAKQGLNRLRRSIADYIWTDRWN